MSLRSASYGSTDESAAALTGEDNSSDWMREARLRAHIERRLLQCDHLLARAHGRAAAWFASADRLAMPQANVAAIDELNELSIALLKVRVAALRAWQSLLADGDVAALIEVMGFDFDSLKKGLARKVRSQVSAADAARMRAQLDETNLALGAWDGPEEIIKLMEGDRNVA